MRNISGLFLLSCMAVACRPAEEPGRVVADAGLVQTDAGLSTADAAPSMAATLTGTVWMPGNGPGQVPEGHEIPVYNAVVYLSTERPEPLTNGASCRPCIEAPSGAVQSDYDGTFTVSNIEPGTHWLVIEKGDFRLEQEVTLGPKEELELEALKTILPSVTDWENGKTIPKIALAAGDFDDLEDILGKMAIGEVDRHGRFVGASAAGVFDLYANSNTNDSADFALGSLADLVRDRERMFSYDIIFIPCSDGAHSRALREPQVLQNIRDYVAAGGKLYVTDWAGDWADNVFPEQIELDPKVDTPAGAYDRAKDTWIPELFGSANGGREHDSYAAQATDESLRRWLNGQKGPLANDGEGEINPDSMLITGNHNHIWGLHGVHLGQDEDGQPVIDTPLKYVVGDDEGEEPKRPLTVTYEPAGCGRVLYSTYHTTQDTHPGLVPQERILVYLIMEIGVCKDIIVID